MDQDLTKMSRDLQDRIGDWVRARGYKGKNTTNLVCRKPLGEGRDVLFDIVRNKMWKHIIWVPSLSCLDPEVHKIANIVPLEVGDVTPPMSLIFGNRVRFIAGEKISEMPFVKDGVNIESLLQEFKVLFERAEEYFLPHVNNRAVTLESLCHPEVVRRLCMITGNIRETKIAHMILLGESKQRITEMMELFDREPDDWKIAGLESPFTNFKHRILEIYLS